MLDLLNKEHFTDYLRVLLYCIIGFLIIDAISISIEAVVNSEIKSYFFLFNDFELLNKGDKVFFIIIWWCYALLIISQYLWGEKRDFESLTYPATVVVSTIFTIGYLAIKYSCLC